MPDDERDLGASTDMFETVTERPDEPPVGGSSLAPVALAALVAFVIGSAIIGFILLG